MTDTSVQTERDTWSEELGQSWYWPIVALSVGLAILGWVSALADPDLPMHLVTAEWILREGRLPVIEPFSWTRAGAPFFAYSWLPELLYLGALNHAGAAGLQAVQALTACAAFLAVVALGRISRWGAWATILIALLSSALWSTFVVAVRPQALMGITLPLAWLGAELIVRRRPWLGGTLVLLNACINVNSHLLFPLTAVPVLRFLAEPTTAWRTVAWYLVLNAVGWLVNPYGLATIGVLRLNFASNPLFDTMSPLVDFWPGFKAIQHAGLSLPMLAFGLVVTAPLALSTKGLTDRERRAFGLAWLLGLALFGTAMRGLVIWWALSLPLLARTAHSIPVPNSLTIRRANVVLTCLVPVGLALFSWRWAEQHTQVTLNRNTRQLPLGSAPILEPLVRWVECYTHAPPGSRAHNIFDHGSYLTYRLPTLSYSIDGRTIFPDSVANADAYQLSSRGPMRLGPWRSADLAFVPLRHALNSVLEGDRDWRLVRVSASNDPALAPVGLWVRNRWLTRFGVDIIPLRADTVLVDRVVPVPASCERVPG